MLHSVPIQLLIVLQFNHQLRYIVLQLHPQCAHNTNVKVWDNKNNALPCFELQPDVL